MSEVRHEAKVSKINQSSIEAVIVSKSACLHCQLKGLCNLSDCKDKLIEIKTPNPHRYQVGEKITVSMSSQNAVLAVFFSYIIPLILIILTLILCNINQISEVYAGLFSLLILIPYYFLLFLNKKYFLKTLEFNIDE